MQRIYFKIKLNLNKKFKNKNGVNLTRSNAEEKNRKGDEEAGGGGEEGAKISQNENFERLK